MESNLSYTRVQTILVCQDLRDSELHCLPHYPNSFSLSFFFVSFYIFVLSCSFCHCISLFQEGSAEPLWTTIYDLICDDYEIMPVGKGSHREPHHFFPTLMTLLFQLVIALCHFTAHCALGPLLSIHQFFCLIHMFHRTPTCSFIPVSHVPSLSQWTSVLIIPVKQTVLIYC